MSSPVFRSISVRRRPLMRWACLCGLLLFVAAPLYAHHLPPGMEDPDEFDQFSAFTAGLRHVMSGIDHWLFALIMGTLSITSLKQGWSTLLSLVSGVALGGFVGLQGFSMPGMSLSVAFSVLVPLTLFALRGRVAPLLPILLTVAASALQGNVHAFAWPMDGAGLSYMGGVLAMTTTFAVAGIIAVHAIRRLAVRISSLESSSSAACL